MVADTATIRELKRKVNKLELEVKEPKIVIQKEIVFDTIETKVEIVKKSDTSFEFEDYYPTKQNPFIKYIAKVNTRAESVVGKFILQPLSLSSSIGIDKEGKYSINSRVPNFTRISDLDVISIPYNKQYKKDVFGFMFGGGYGKSFEIDSQFLTMQTGVRINKTYLFLNAGTNQTVGASLMVEF